MVSLKGEDKHHMTTVTRNQTATHNANWTANVVPRCQPLLNRQMVLHSFVLEVGIFIPQQRPLPIGGSGSREFGSVVVGVSFQRVFWNVPVKVQLQVLVPNSYDLSD